MTAGVVRIHADDQAEAPAALVHIADRAVSGSPAPEGPTLAEVRTWPATVSISQACRALGISRSFGYELSALNQFPARCLRVGGSVRVLTVSLIRVLSGEDP